MIEIEKNQIFSSEGRYLRRKGTDTYFRRAIALASDTVDDFEEVAELPPYTKAEYDAKVSELVRRRYTDSEEFALQRKMIEAMLHPEAVTVAEGEELPGEVSEFNAYNEYVGQCKEMAKDPELYKRDEPVIFESMPTDGKGVID